MEKMNAKGYMTCNPPPVSVEEKEASSAVKPRKEDGLAF